MYLCVLEKITTLRAWAGAKFFLSLTGSHSVSQSFNKPLMPEDQCCVTVIYAEFVRWSSSEKLSMRYVLNLPSAAVLYPVLDTRSKGNAMKLFIRLGPVYTSHLMTRILLMNFFRLGDEIKCRFILDVEYNSRSFSACMLCTWKLWAWAQN